MCSLGLSIRINFPLRYRTRTSSDPTSYPSLVFSAAIAADPTYDAYDKDIALASFYFESAQVQNTGFVVKNLLFVVLYVENVH